MRLYEVPNNTRIRVVEPEDPPPGAAPIEKAEYNFHHLDGMYSYCTDNYGEVFHLKAWTEVEIA